MSASGSDHDTLTREEAEILVADGLVASNVTRHTARIVALALVAAEIDGQAGHGFSRVASYAAQAASGKVDGKAIPQARQAGTALVQVDACNGYAYPAINLAIERLSALVEETGIAAAAITRSNHAGQLGAHVERLAERGMVAIMVANTPHAMAPWGGEKPLFGTNPIAFATPRQGKDPIVIDLSLSKVARGKIMAANQRGEAIPEGWALDADGNPTTDAKAALAGSMIPAGDAKGAALAVMVEILAATLTGANHSYQASSFFDGAGDPPGVGQLIIAIKADSLTGAAFAPRLEELASEIESQDGARLPGTTRLAGRTKAATDGLQISTAMHQSIKDLAAE